MDQDELPSTRRFGRGAPPPEGLAAEIAALREEQQHLRDELDEVKRAKKKPEKKDDEESDGDDDEKEEEKGDDDEKEEEKKPPFKERVSKEVHEHPVRSGLVALVAVGAIVGGIAYYLHTRTYEDTDDAQVDADISAVSPRVQGTIAAVYVVDNQIVHAGDLIAEIDPRDLDTALQQARAQLNQALAQLDAEKPNVPITNTTNATNIASSNEDVATVAAELAQAEKDLDTVKSNVTQADANDKYAQLERERMLRLAAIGAVSTTQSDQRMTQAAASSATVESTRHQVEAAEKKIQQQRARLASAQSKLEQTKANAPQQLLAREASVKLNQAAVEVARARLAQAELDKSYARIVAPVDGVIGKKGINVGDRVQPGQEILAITQTDHVWVTANYRETQLEKFKTGLRTTVHVDAIDLDFNGDVESMPGATGARYSLLPPENATGNYVKVVQRLPVRIKIYDKQKGWERLRPGMSVEPKVYLP